MGPGLEHASHYFTNSSNTHQATQFITAQDYCNPTSAIRHRLLSLYNIRSSRAKSSASPRSSAAPEAEAAPATSAVAPTAATNLQPNSSQRDLPNSKGTQIRVSYLGPFHVHEAQHDAIRGIYGHRVGGQSRMWAPPITRASARL